MKKKVFVAALLWVCLLCVSLFWNVRSMQTAQDRITIQTARALFELMVTTRRWNASHKGVYVRVTENTQPNPYLDDVNRDIVCDGITLTMINPAFMTRQISQVTEAKHRVSFRMTSLDPINPKNKADAWEAAALKGFTASTISEKGVRSKQGGQPVFNYIKGLRAEESCLDCHKNKSLKLNDILGGIRINIQNPAKADLAPVLIWHAAIGGIGLLLILIYGFKLTNAYDTIRHQAVFDALTGIPNRRSFNDRFLSEARRAVRMKSPLSVIMADIDHFKKYNDTYGHERGDEVLSVIAQTIQDTLKRPVDFCARYGGEEFIMILPDTGTKGAAHVAGLILKHVRDLDIEHKTSDTEPRVTISLGIATQTNVPVNYEDIVTQADKALYRAKSNGRNRFEIFG